MDLVGSEGTARRGSRRERGREPRRRRAPRAAAGSPATEPESPAAVAAAAAPGSEREERTGPASRRRWPGGRAAEGAGAWLVVRRGCAGSALAPGSVLARAVAARI